MSVLETGGKVPRMICYRQSRSKTKNDVYDRKCMSDTVDLYNTLKSANSPVLRLPTVCRFTVGLARGFAGP
jgi:hypothetical protein